MAKGKYHDWLTPEGLLKIEGWARDGLTDEQIAANIGINRDTLYRWKKEFADFSDALKKGKEVVDRQVENALLKRALGYEYTEVTRERIKDTGQKQRHEGTQKLTESGWEVAKSFFGHRCCYCGEQTELTKDHLDPLKNGGQLIRENVVPCCRSCNSSKKDSHWLAWYQKQPFYNQERAQRIADYITFVAETSESETDNDDGKMVVTKEVTKQVAGDTTAQIFWLKNRMPHKYRDRKDVAIEGEVNNPFKELSTDELKKLIGSG